jgi:hypothetical protein
MRAHLTRLAGFLALGSTACVMLSLLRGQDGVPPRSASAPAAGRKPGRDPSKLQPLQRQFYLSAQSGATWLARMNVTRGRFVPGLLPAVYAPLEHDHPLRQAGAACALARAARYFEDADEAARATQAILSLLEDTAADPATQVRRPTLSAQAVNPLAAAALLVLAINELPSPGADLLSASEQLCNYLRSQQQPNGTLNTGKDSAGDPEAAGYPGLALYALMRSQQHRSAAWKTALVRKALPLYLAAWRQHKDRDAVYWQTAACAEVYLRTKDKAFAEAVFEMNDWLCGLQYDRLDPRHPRWLGGFMNWTGDKPAEEAPDIRSALCASSLAEACRVTRQFPDLPRHTRYTDALEGCLRFLTTLQFSEGDTQHFADWYRPRLVGGFHGSHQDGNLRIDYTEHAVAALVQYLFSVTPAP